ncbi:MAG: polyphosphate polymerase domain-containing protein [Oscillospiraceae bacterium]|nr:polyphosphate polymerase domain-containing protein [Oscillospiraceae bacterium]
MDNKIPVYRHEFKYVVSASQLILIENRIKNLMEMDVHTGNKGMYNIRSLYFDDYYDRCLYENINGTDPREKFRIRIYNHSRDRITLECKRKQNGKTLKTSCPLSEEQTRILMKGRALSNIAEQPPLLQKFTVEMLSRGLHPVTIVEYDRIPYIYKNGNVRVTLDMNISSSKSVLSFLDDVIPKRPVMPAGQHLLEVKYDEYIPDFIYKSIRPENLKYTAYSKYYMCRKYTL